MWSSNLRRRQLESDKSAFIENKISLLTTSTKGASASTGFWPGSTSDIEILFTYVTLRQDYVCKTESRSRFASTAMPLSSHRQEYDQFQKAFQKEEFRKLFFEYAQELQDPENKRVSSQINCIRINS
jgi:hypothetical protein